MDSLINRESYGTVHTFLLHTTENVYFSGINDYPNRMNTRIPAIHSKQRGINEPKSPMKPHGF